jgi:hypothetical protein
MRNAIGVPPPGGPKLAGDVDGDRCAITGAR